MAKNRQETKVSARELQEKIAKLQTMEQTVQQYLMKRQQFMQQAAEVDGALVEIESSEEVYKITYNQDYDMGCIFWTRWDVAFE